MKHTKLAEYIKRILVIFMAVVFGFVAIPHSNAQTSANRLKNTITRLETKASVSALNQERRLANIKKRADTLVNNRMSDLNRLLERVQNDKRLSDEEKTSLSSDIQTTINGLSTLKAKIDADTDVNTAKEDTKKIITDFYIYKLFIPKIRLLVTIDNLMSLSSRLSNLTVNIQNLIDTLKSQGKDVSSLQSLLDDINSNLQNINPALSSDKTKVMGVYNTTSDPKTVFSGVRKDLAKVRSDFAKIRHDIGQMREDFKINIKTGEVSSPSP